MISSERWILRRNLPDPLPPQYAPLHPLLARVLYARQVAVTRWDIASFLFPAQDAGDPFALPDMEVAVRRLLGAIKRGGPIVVYGDFDADGVTATALLVSALASLGAQARPYIPDRFEEGYGLNIAAMERIHREGAELLVTVDCGIRSPDEVARARALGLDVILTDHHSVPETLPPALAVVNPKRADSDYPFPDLAGVGVAYRLVQALAAVAPAELGIALDPNEWLDFVAIGTVADVVPLTGENRALVQQGLQRLRCPARPGLVALATAARVSAGNLTSQDIAFRLGPRLNATGRLEHGKLAYSLLTCADAEQAEVLAAELERLNSERQDLLAQQVAQAEATMAAEPGPPDLVLVHGPDYHEGIVGLVASRLAERYHRPTLVMRTRPDGTTRGSARSPALKARASDADASTEFSITRALASCEDLLIRFGGHAQAAGFTLETTHLEAFRQRLRAYCAETIDPASLTRQHLVDAIVGLGELDLSAARALQSMEPFGQGNPPPTLASLGVELVALRPLGAEGQHVRLHVRQNGVVQEAIAFRQGGLAEEFAIGERIDLLYQPDINAWNGQERLQLVVIAARKHAGSPQ